jgi:hypothetical protein
MHEVALVLEVAPRIVRNMVRRGELRDIGSGRLRRIDPAQVAGLVANRPLAMAALDAIVAGRFQPARVSLDAQPASLIESWESLW